MCGRYFFDPDDYEILTTDPDSPALNFSGGEIRPTNTAPILMADHSISLATWGHKWSQGGLLLHARSESVHEKPTFREAFKTSRCMIPTSGYYEWLHIDGKSQRGQKYFFHRPATGDQRLYLAGLVLTGRDGPAFVIITRDAAPFMIDIHDRMPQTLESEEVRDWLADETFALEVMRQPQAALAKEFQGK